DGRTHFGAERIRCALWTRSGTMIQVLQKRAINRHMYLVIPGTSLQSGVTEVHLMSLRRLARTLTLLGMFAICQLAVAQEHDDASGSAPAASQASPVDAAVADLEKSLDQASHERAAYEAALERSFRALRRAMIRASCTPEMLESLDKFD